MTVRAVFVFNHKYERNIAALERIYADRFASRRYIVPFAESPSESVLGVYETSWNFSGHIAQAGARFIDPDVSHYMFIADDLILNPALNEANLADALELGPDTGYIKSLTAIDRLRYRWPWAGEAAMSLRKYGRGFDYRAELPAADVAQAKFAAMGLRLDAPSLQFRDLRTWLWDMPRLAPWCFAMGLGVLGKRSDYPLLGGYADFVVVPASAIHAFVHYCGVFAAMKIFAEVAVPTALALATDRIVTELAIGEHFRDTDTAARTGLPLRGIEFWAKGEADAYAARTERRIDRLLGDFPADQLYVHPVKLSAFR